jgi:hypothetical protein
MAIVTSGVRSLVQEHAFRYNEACPIRTQKFRPNINDNTYVAGVKNGLMSTAHVMCETPFARCGTVRPGNVSLADLYEDDEP